MTPEALLSSLGLEEHLPAFIAQGIDAGVLPTLTDADLRELGVAKLGDRKKLLAAIARLAAEAALPAGDAGTSLVAGWAETWPTPVAVALSEYAREEHPVARLWTACDAVEMTLRLLVIAGVARQAREGVLPEKLAREMREILETPTLGGWFVLAQALVQCGEPAEVAWVKGPLRELLYGPEKPGTPETSFLRLRNRLAHGGGLTRTEAARLFSLWRERFEAAFSQGGFFANWELLGRTAAGGWRQLRGPEGGPVEAPAVPADAKADAVWLRRGEQLTLLWPLAIFGQPFVESAPRGGGDAPQVYSRKEAVRLTYTPVGLDGLAQSESGEGALRAFERLFESRGLAATEFKVAGFEADLRKDATQMVGRQRELEHVLAAIRETPQGVLWLSGAAGMGKSFLLAKVATSLLEEHQDSRTLVLAYRFRSGDLARCSRESLAQFVVERLQAAAVLKPLFEDEQDEKPSDPLVEALGLIADDVRVILLLDGLDEVQRRDDKFAEEVALGVRVPRLVCVCAGRPEPAIEQAMRQLGGRTLFAEGLPPMGGDDIRGMLLEKIGPLRKKLLGHDREQGDAVMNPFIDLVAQRAAGLPLYVKYVVGDVLANRYRVLDGDESLPDSLHAYHEELLRRLGVGDLQAVVTPLAATLACACEPLTVAQLEAVFLHRKLIRAEGGRSLLERGLAALAAMVTSAPTPEGAVGYTLFHQSLRDHILASPQMTQSVGTSREAWGDLAVQPAAPAGLDAYLVRNAVPHLLVLDRKPDAERLLLDLERLERMDQAGVPWMSVCRWWTELGGARGATLYVEVIRGALGQPGAFKPVLQQCRKVLQLCQKSGWFDSVLAAGELVLTRAEVELGPDDADASWVLNCLGLAALDRRDFPRAAQFFRRAFETRSRLLGPGDGETLKVLNNLGLLSWRQGDFAAARDCWERAHAGFERLGAAGEASRVAAAANLAVALEQLGEATAAEEMSRWTLAERERILGAEHPDTLKSLNNRGKILSRRGDWLGAEKLHRRALVAREKVLGSEHPDTLSSLQNLGNALLERGEVAASEELMRRALRGREQTLGPDHAFTLESVDALAGLLWRKGNRSEAEALRRRAVAARLRVLGPAHP
jgi:tetratricopeptide (TPR) repeat protein